MEKTKLKERKSRTQKGITLVALIITIIVLLILAVVAIRAVQGDGIITKAKEATTRYETSKKDEEQKLLEYEYQIARSQGEVGSFEEYVTNKELNTNYPGLKLGDKVNYEVPEGKAYNGEWRVLGIENGQLLLVATASPTEMALSGSDATLGVWDEKTNSYKNAEGALNTKCEEYLNTSCADRARSIEITDINRITGYDETTFDLGNGYKYGDVVKYNIDTDNKLTYKKNDEDSVQTNETKFRKPLSESNITETFTVTNNSLFYMVEHKTNKVYQMLFGNYDQIYWLASSYATPNNESVSFGMLIQHSGTIINREFWSSDSGDDWGERNYGIRPVIYLNSDVQLTQTSENSGEWTIGD